MYSGAMSAPSFDPLPGPDDPGVQLKGDATKWRLFAFNVDVLLALAAALLVGSRIPDSTDEARLGAAAAVFLSYFLVQEGPFGTTIGKRLFGLRVCRLDGSPCGWGPAVVRTLLRIVEVNPAIFGCLPAALVGAFSPRHQRIGDMLAGGVVVRHRARAATATQADVDPVA